MAEQVHEPDPRIVDVQGNSDVNRIVGTTRDGYIVYHSVPNSLDDVEWKLEVYGIEDGEVVNMHTERTIAGVTPHMKDIEELYEFASLTKYGKKIAPDWLAEELPDCDS